MSPRDIRSRLEDILTAIEETIDSTAGMAKAEFCGNRTLIKAVMMNFIIIGESAGNIPVEIQKNHSDVPWQDMKRMRNAVTHSYFRLDLDTMWKTIHRDLPPLIPQIRTILDNLDK